MQAATILIITTDAQRQHFLTDTLTKAGYTLHHAAATAQALALFNAHNPSLVLIDAEIHGDDGYLLAERIKEGSDSNHTALLMMVPQDDAAVLRAFAAGADDCIGQQVAPILVRRRVKNLIDSGNGHSNADPAPEAATGKYHDLFHMANDAIIVADLITGQILDLNRRAERWLGYTKEHLLDLTYNDLLAPDQDQPSDKQMVEELSTRGHFIFEQNFNTCTGHLVKAEVSSRILTYDDRRATLNIIRDISMRKQLEQDEREQRQLANSLIESAAALNETLALDDVLARVLDHVTKIIHADTVSVMLLDHDDPSQAHIRAHRGYDLDDTARAHWHDSPWQVTEIQTLRTLLKTRRPLIVNDVTTYPGWKPTENVSIASYMGAPIIANDTVIGFINVDDTHVNRFQPAEANYLMAFANQAGIALENARLHEAARNYADTLERRVEERTAQLSEANTHLKEQIVERQRAEEAMIEERNLLRTVVNNLPDHVFLKDLKGRFIMTNETMRDFFEANHATRDITGKTDYDFVEKSIADEYRSEDKRIIALGEPIINREITFESNTMGTQHYLSTKVPLRDQNGDIIGIVGINRDITALRAADAALKAEQKLLLALFDHIPNEIYVKDRDSKIIMANRTLINRLGHRVPDVIGTTNTDYAYDDYTISLAQKSLEEERRMMEQGEGIITKELELTDPHGAMRWFRAYKILLRDSDDNVIGILGINRDIHDEKQAEERITQIITGARALLWYAIVQEKDGEMVYDFHISSEEAAQAFLPLDVPAGQTYPQTLAQSILPDDFKTLRENTSEAIRNGKSEHNSIFRCRRADGKIRWLNESVQITPLMPGRYSMVGVVTDITAQREAELTLRATNDLLEQRVIERTARLSEANEQLLEQIGERNRAELAERQQRELAEALIATAAALNQTLDLNKVLDRILTYVSRVVPPHRTAEILIIEDDIYVKPLRHRIYTTSGQVDKATPKTARYRLRNAYILRRIMDKGQVVIRDVAREIKWLPPEGHSGTRAYIGVTIRTEGRVIGFLILTSDMPSQFTQEHAETLVAFSNQAGIAIENARLFATVQDHAATLEERIAERTRELEYERAQLHAILDAMTDGVVYHDTDRQPQYINQSLVQLMGYSMMAWLSDAIWPQQIAPDDEVVALLNEEAVEGTITDGIWAGEARLKRKNGEIFDARLVMTRVSDADGHFSGAVTVIRDVSAEKRLEAQKTRFIATASHELRTPITNMMTRLYLIERQPDNLKRHLSVMTTVTQRLKELVDDLLDLSRFENGIIQLETHEQPIRPLVESVVTTQEAEADNRQINLTATVLTTDLTVDVDAGRILQVLTNLVTNAINYTPEGGAVEVSIDAAPSGPEAAHGWGVIAVRDTGIGIAEDALADVFQPFVRANDFSPGMGLGLSISREIIESHNGEISVASTLGAGTTFTIKLPLVHPPGIHTEAD